MQAVKYCLAILLLSGLWSCQKSKPDFLFEEQPQLPPLTSSTVRIMNMGRKATELLINDTLLTSRISPNIEGLYLDAQTRASLYFPSGRMGSSYTIPQRFIRQDGTAHIKIASMIYGSKDLVYPKDFDIREDVNNPTDYYNVLFGAHNSSEAVLVDSLFAVPRKISPPANPEHFRIRLLNLGSAPDMASLEGNMSLVLADGTKINPVTTSVAPGKYSDYIELPYGTYQFKVMTDDGRIIPGVPVNSEEQLKTVNSATGTLVTGNNPVVDKMITYAPIRTFQPGGVYTIMVCANYVFDYYQAGSNMTTPLALNSFRIITDVNESQNITYGRIQAVNAMPNTGVSVSVDNMPLNEGTLAFGKSSSYKTLITGTHTVTIKDATGNKLAEQQLSVSGSTNYSAWLYPDAGGKPVLKLIANNLSGSFYLNSGGKGDDGSNNQYAVTMPYWIRFLNLSTDVPEVTFTEANGDLLKGYLTFNATASQHLRQGQVVIEQPYVLFSPVLGLNKLMAYASQPGVLPGDWIRDIPVLNGSDFIAKPDLYKGMLPGYETGFYTVALTGSLHPKNPGDAPARLIIIKHNQ
ncbi:DUF4397 domain-containing protein [Chitinophaga flava]|nr:DUF4397 domain-containing protein [Chitinophaga flava]